MLNYDHMLRERATSHFTAQGLSTQPDLPDIAVSLLYLHIDFCPQGNKVKQQRRKPFGSSSFQTCGNLK